MHKKCGKCKEILPIECFGKKKKHLYQSYCIECRRTYNKRHYDNNKKRYRDNVMKRRKNLAQKFFKYLENHPCACGEKNPILLECHHIGKKSFGISEMVHNGYSWRSIKKELKTCDIKCVRCHRLETAKQFGWYAHILS